MTLADCLSEVNCEGIGFSWSVGDFSIDDEVNSEESKIVKAIMVARRMVIYLVI